MARTGAAPPGAYAKHQLRGLSARGRLWDIEARIVDTKTFSDREPFRGRREPGEPVHDMVLRPTIDGDICVPPLRCVRARFSERLLLPRPWRVPCVQHPAPGGDGRASGRRFDARRTPGYPPYDVLQLTYRSWKRATWTPASGSASGRSNKAWP